MPVKAIVKADEGSTPLVVAGKAFSAEDAGIGVIGDIAAGLAEHDCRKMVSRRRRTTKGKKMDDQNECEVEVRKMG